MYHIQSMNVAAQEPVPLNTSLLFKDCRFYRSATSRIYRSSKRFDHGRLSAIQYVIDATAQNITAHLILYKRAGEAVYSAQGQEEVKGLVNYYMQNCDTILNGLKDTNLKLFGGINAPYIWLKTPGNMTGWDFFDFLLEKAKCCWNSGRGIRSGELNT